MLTTFRGRIFLLFAFTFVLVPAAQPATFEVASIKPAPASVLEVKWGPEPGGRFSAQGATAKQLVALAYGVRESQIWGGPKWLSQDRWTIRAKAANFPGIFNRQQLLDAMKSVLVDRFGLRIRLETREVPVYLLLIAKCGQKLGKAMESSPFMHSGRGSVEGKGVSMDLLARTLAGVIDHSVINQTGIEGTYEVRLRWMPDQGLNSTTGVESTSHNGDSGLGSLFTEIQNQLGLRLKADRGPGDIIEIEQVKRPSEN